MAWTYPYRGAHYMGEFANDAAALTGIQTLEWDTNKDGTGTPEDGMLYFDTTLNQLKLYASAAWNALAAGSDTLQSAYVAGNTITTSTAEGNLAITLGQDGDDFEVFVGTDQFRLTRTGADTMDVDWDANSYALSLATTYELDAAGAITIESSAAAISIGADAVAQNVSIGTGGARTIEVGSAGAAEVHIIADDIDIDSDGAVAIDATTTLSLDALDDTNLTMTANNAAAKALSIAATNAGAGAGNLLLSADDEIDLTASGLLDMQGTAVTLDSTSTSITLTSNTFTQIISANNGAGPSGAVDLTSGTGTTGTGNVTISTGDASAGNPGNIILDIGNDVAGTNTQPSIRFRHNGGDLFEIDAENALFDFKTGPGADTTYGLLLPDNDTDVAGTLSQLAFDVTKDGLFIRDAGGWEQVALYSGVPRLYTNAGNPNGTVLPSKAGDLCLDTTNDFLYGNVDGTNAGWTLLG